MATITSMPLYYDPRHLEAYRTWDQVTHHGYLSDSMDWSRCNGLYIVSGVIDSRWRGLNIFAPMVLQVARLAQSMGLRYVLAGAVLPGYRRYRERQGALDAYDYCMTRRGNHPVDPLLAMYEAIGFFVRDRDHVVAEYFPDDDSMNHGAIVVRDLELSPFTR